MRESIPSPITRRVSCGATSASRLTVRSLPGRPGLTRGLTDAMLRWTPTRMLLVIVVSSVAVGYATIVVTCRWVRERLSSRRIPCARQAHAKRARRDY